MSDPLDLIAEPIIDTDHLLYENSNGVALITLNQPEKLNAMSFSMMIGLVNILRQISIDPRIKVVAITGQGRGFCSGGDLGGMSKDMMARVQSGDIPEGLQITPELRHDAQRLFQESCRLLHELPKVTIALVNGPAAGAGFALALACDMRLGSTAAMCTTSFAKVAFSGDFGISWKLTRLLGEAKAKELLFLSEKIKSEELLSLGLINRLYPDVDFKSESMKFVDKISKGPQLAYRYMKENVNLSLNCDYKTLLDREAVTMIRTSETQDHMAGVKAYMSKTEAEFKGA